MNQEFLFCPRCGAVTPPGVCTNCGFRIETEKEEVNETNNESTTGNEGENLHPFYNVNNDGNTSEAGAAFAQPEKKKSKGLIIGIILGIVAVVFLIVALIAVAAIAVVPIAFKSIYTANNSIYNNNNINTTPTPDPDFKIELDTDDDEDEDEDDKDKEEDEEDEDDTDNDIDYEEYSAYYDTITPLYGGTSKFDYDKFVEDFANNANEYWDEPADDASDYYINGPCASYMQSPYSHEFAERDGFSTPYYEYVVDSYVENKNYSVERRLIRFEGQINGIFANAYCAYYTLDSDKVDFTAVNETLRNQALTSLYDYCSNHSSSEYKNYTLYSDCVITFNNDEICSIAYNTTAYLDNSTETFYIHGINIDTKNGEVMDNTKILNIDDDFSKFFVSRSNTQNSFVDSINYSDIKDVTKVLNDDDSLILLFTPLGIEVGCNYRYHYSYGWVTVTINNFDSYLSGNYTFNADFGKGYDIYKYEKEHGIISDGYDSDEDDDYFDL